MDEDQFRAVYQEINEQRCVFEKALNNRRCDCSRKSRFLLATREGVGCRSQSSLANCTDFISQLRDKSRFALRETFIDGPLPHNKELKVQAGGTLALQALLEPNESEATQVADIYELINMALAKYGNIESFPYGELVKGVLHYQSRSRRKRR